MDEDEWKEKIKKWENGINPVTTTKEDLQEYLDTKLYQYSIDRTTDDNLWDLFKDDFKSFDLLAFNRYNRTELQRLRSYLRCGGVSVDQNTNRLTIAQSLLNVVNEETKRVWNEDDITQFGPVRADLKNGPITSVFVTLEGAGRSDAPNVQPPPPLPQPQPQPPPPPEQGVQNVDQPPPLLPPPLPFNPGAPQVIPAAKLIGEVARIYTEDQKYDGTNGSFDHKLTIFLDICQRVDLPQDALMRAFPTMLKGLAQDFFYNNTLSQRTYEVACTNIRNFFEGPEYQRRNLDKWNATDLNSTTAKHPEKSIFEVVQILINELRQLQFGLTTALRSTEFLHNKIVTACQGSLACRYVVSDPPADLG